MQFCAAIIMYNPDIKVLDRIKNYSQIFNEVYAIDNSDLELHEIVNGLKMIKNCKYINMGGNKGMALALNLAFSYSIKQEYDFILTMDQDSNYSNLEILKMFDYINSNYQPFVGIYSANYAKTYFDKLSGNFFVDKPVQKLNSIKNVDFCMTSGSFVNVNVLNKILPLDDYFIGYVDYLLCYKMKRLDYELIRVGNSFFSQQVGELLDKSYFNRLFKIVKHKGVRYYYMIRNNLYLQREFGKDIRILLSLNLGLIRILLNLLLGEENKIQKMKYVFLGIVDFTKNKKGIISEKLAS